MRAQNKIKNNPFRQVLRGRGYTLSEAAGALNVTASTLSCFLRAYDPGDNLAARILALPDLSEGVSNPQSKENQ